MTTSQVQISNKLRIFSSGDQSVYSSRSIFAMLFELVISSLEADKQVSLELATQSFGSNLQNNMIYDQNFFSASAVILNNSNKLGHRSAIHRMNDF